MRFAGFLALICLYFASRFSSAQTINTVSCQVYGGQPVTVTTTGVTPANCSAPAESLINASVTVSLSDVATDPTGNQVRLGFSYSAMTGGQAWGLETGIATASSTASIQLLIPGPPRPGYVYVGGNTNTFRGGAGGPTFAEFSLPGLPLDLDEEGIAHMFPVTLQNMLFTASTGGTANDFDTILADAPDFEADTSVQLVFYEADGVTLVPVGWDGNMPLAFVPVSPCRVVDTRNAAGPFGGPSLTAGETRSYPIPNGACGIPSSAFAYSLNATVVPHDTLGWLTLWPSDKPQPYVSNLNSLDGRIKASAAIVPAATDGSGSIDVYATDPTDVILDINGYFELAGTNPGYELLFHPVTPCRVWDTRQPGDGPLISGLVRSFAVAGVCGVPASGATAYSMNITAVPTAPSLGYLTLFPGGESVPLVSTLNAPTGTITANAAIVEAGLGGAISAFASDSTNLVIDINGYYSSASDASGLYFFSVPPARILDTRATTGMFNGTLTFVVAGAATPIPANALAFVLNATVVPAGSLAYLTLWPYAYSMPVVSTLNALDGWITSNMAIVPNSLAPGGEPTDRINVFAPNNTDLILDAFGYFR